LEQPRTFGVIGRTELIAPIFVYTENLSKSDRQYGL
jgi:hypothetical protein